MTSLVSLKSDLAKILSEANWLFDEGFSFRSENEYIAQFRKEEVSILVDYGRFSDRTDVFVQIDSPNSKRYENGKPLQYSVFEAAMVDPSISNSTSKDGFDTAKRGLDLLFEHRKLFDLEYLENVEKLMRA